MSTDFLPTTPFQLCWVVSDLAGAEANLTRLTGADNWLRIPNQLFSRDATTVDGVPTEYSANVSLAYSGAQQIEIIEPVSDAGPYQRWLETNGPGMHHVGYIVDDIDLAHTALADAGFRPHVRGTIGDHLMDFAYLTDPTLGTAVEIMALSADMRAMFDSLIPDGYANPWQRDAK